MTTAQKYTTDIVYPSQFGIHQTPINLSYIAACHGLAPPDIREPFTYCDLACGDATTLELMAACYPHAKFVGYDLNKEHVETARARISEQGIANIEIVEADLTNLSPDDLPSSDFVTIAGTYSWVDDQLRQKIHHLLSGALSEQGLAYIHYTAQPGAAQLHALYHTVQQIGTQVEGPSDLQFQKSFATMGALKNAGAIFFRENKAASAAVDAWFANDPSNGSDNNKDRVAGAFTHEVMNAQPNSFYFDQVEADLASVGLSFVGRAVGTDNYTQLALPADIVSILEATTSTISKQMLQDLAANTTARRDIFSRSENKPTEYGDAFLESLFLARLSTGDPRHQLKGVVAIDLFALEFGALLNLVTNEPRRWGDLAASEPLSKFDPKTVRKTIEHLVALGMFQLIVDPVQSSDPAASTGAKFKLSASINQRQLRAGMRDPLGAPLVAPAAGTQIMMPPSDRMMLFVLTGGDPREAWEYFKTRSDVPADAKSESGYAKFVEVLNKNLENFRQVALPSLLTLGIVETAS